MAPLVFLPVSFKIRFKNCFFSFGLTFRRYMFTHPYLLWGLFCVLLPLVIHLINLLRHRPVEWGAMEFLLAAYRKHRTRVRLLELLLLLLRMGLIALIVLMLAGPVIRSVLPGGEKTHHVVILDDSFSMNDRLGESSVFESARDTVRKLTDELARQGGVHNLTLVRTSRSHGKTKTADVHAQRLSRSFRETFLANQLTALKPSYTSGGLEETLEYAAELAPETAGGTRVLYVISDFRRRDWHENPALAERLSALSRDGFRLHFIDCSPTAHPNLGLSALKPREGIQAAGVPLLWEVRVTNFGASPAQNVVLRPEIFQMGEGGQTQTLPTVSVEEIPAGQSVVAAFPVTFPLEGNYGLRCTLPPDAVADDNQVNAALLVPSFESVLVIDDSLDGSSSRFLRTALSPGDRVQTGVSPRVENARFLSTNDLSAFRSIYLVDPASLEPQAVAALEEYLKNGGGVAIFVGPHTDPLTVQKWYKDGKGFFPVLLDETEELPEYYAAPDLRVGDHPIFKVFSSDSSNQFNTFHVERYYKLDDVTLENLIPLASSDTSSKEKTTALNQTEAGPEPVYTIAALRNNSPLVVERAFGRGNVVLFLTTADRTWTDWPVGNPARPNPFAQGSYVVMLLQLQAYLTREQFVSWTVGDVLSTSFKAGDYEVSVPFLKPDASPWERFNAVAGADGHQTVTTSPTEEPGVYSAEFKGMSGESMTRLFAVNPSAEEGATQKITREELAAGLKGIPFDCVSAEAFRFSASDAAQSALADWLLALCLIWCLFEMFVAEKASGKLN